MPTRGAAVLALAVTLGGCADEGKCAYDDNEFRDVNVTIARIDQEPEGWTVRVEGDVFYTFEFNDHDYQLCVVDMGLAEGDPAPVQVLSGGDCPTEYRLGPCDGYI